MAGDLREAGAEFVTGGSIDIRGLASVMVSSLILVTGTSFHER